MIPYVSVGYTIGAPNDYVYSKLALTYSFRRYLALRGSYYPNGRTGLPPTTGVIRTELTSTDTSDCNTPYRLYLEASDGTDQDGLTFDAAFTLWPLDTASTSLAWPTNQGLGSGVTKKDTSFAVVCTLRPSSNSAGIVPSPVFGPSPAPVPARSPSPAPVPARSPGPAPSGGKGSKRPRPAPPPPSKRRRPKKAVE